MRRYTKYYLTSIVILITAWLINAQFAGTPINRWTKSAEMTSQRAAACSVQLSDGRVLVAGGRSDAAVLNSVEVSGSDGTFISVASMSQPRAGAACIALPDGRVLVAGGNDGKANLASAEVYDAKQDAWQSVGEMSVARSGHTATATPWGAVLLTGGEETGAVEMFLLNDTFRSLGTLATGRTDHAIAATYDHKVIIAGGSHNGTALSTVEVYDGDTGKLIPGGTMLAARRSFSAAPLVDGTVLITGGYGANGAILNTTEIFDPQKGESVAGPTMSSARANHKSTVLPSNGRVLIIGGTDENGVTSTNEIYTPWTRKFGTVPAMHSARQQMAVAPLRRGAIVVAGGKGENGILSGSEVFGYSTIDTDKADYAPGEQATFMGTGWKPGEQVLLQVSAFPLDQHSVEFTAVTQADSVGRIKITPFNIDRSHLGVRFLATATGSESQAQNTFTDGEAAVVTMTLSSPINVYGTAVTPSGHVLGAATNPVSAGAVSVSVDGLAAYSVGNVVTGGDFTGSSISNLTPGSHYFIATYTGGGPIWNDSTSSTVTYNVTAGTATALTSPSGSGALGSSVTFTASVSGTAGAPAPTSGSVNFINASNNTVLASANVSAGIATVSISTLASNGGVAYAFAAVYVPASGNGYSTSTSGNVAYTVSKGNPTPSVTVSPLNPTVGTNVNITGCLAPVGGFVPSGLIQIKDGVSNISGNLTLSGGCGSFASSAIAGGSHTLTLTYVGDTNFNPAAGGSAVVVWNKAGTVSTVSTNPVSPVGVGTSVALVGTITSPASAVTGFVIGGAANATFQDNLIDVPGCIGLTVTNGQVTCNISTLTVGTHPITVNYLNADQNFGPSTSPKYNLVISNASTVTTLSANQSSIAIGGSVTYTASVQGSPTASGDPTGNVTFFDGGSTPLCSAVTVTAANPAIATCTKVYDASSPVLSSGTHQITATYNPTGTFTGSTSLPVSLAVAKQAAIAGSLTTIPASPVTYNTATTARAVFSPAVGGPALTGTVSFYDGAILLGSTAVVSAGNTDLVLPDSVIKKVATHTLTAQYGGDSNYAASVAPFPVTNLLVNKATVTLTPTSPGGTLAYGSSQNFSATVTSGAGTPTGTITWSSGALTIGSATLPATSTTVNLTMLPQGLSAVTVTYSGDANFAGIADSTTFVTIGKATPAVNVISSQNPSTYNQSVMLTAAVTSPAGGTPTGTVTFMDGASVLQAGVALVAGSASYTTSSLATGPHNITAAYSGDTNFNLFTSTPALVQTVNPGSTVITLSPSNTSPALNSSVVYSFTVTGGSAPPQGTVSITDSITGSAVALGECSLIAVVVNPAPPSNSSNGSCTVSYDNSNAQHGPGVHQLTATYASANLANWANVTSSVKTVTTGKAATSVAQPASSAGNSFTYGANTTLSAVVTPTTAAPNYAINTVQFYDGNTPVGAPVTPSSTTGIATFTTTTPLLVGTHLITAQFLGDSNYSASLQSPNLSISVTKATPAPVTLTSPAPAYVTTYGGLLTTGVTNIPVVGAGVIPTGTVTLSSGGIAIATGTLDGSGNFTFTNVQMPSAINAGAGQNLTVTYNGDSNYTAATFVSANGLTVNAATSTAAVTSAPISPAAYGQNVTFRVTLTGPGNPATGTISFTSDGNPINATCTAPAAVVTANIATCTVAATTANNLGAGSHIITVANFTEANGNHVMGAVTALNPFVVGAPAPQIVIGSNQNPSVYGQAVTFTATVSGPTGALAPVGQLQFFDGNGTIGGLQTIATSAANVVTYTLTVPSGSLPTLTGGTHAISATYVPLTPGNTPDPNYSNGSSQTQTPPSVLQQVVNRAPSQTVNNAAAVPVVASVNIVPASSVYGQAATFSVDVIPNTGNVGTPTGIVIFKADGLQFGPAVALQSVGLIQRAQLANFTGLSRGVHGITAEYQGDANFNASVTASTPFTVDYDNTKTIMGSVPASPTFGAQITLTAQVCGLVAGSATLCNGALPVGPSSTITFFDGSTPLGTTGPVDATGTGSVTILLQNPPFTNAPGGGSPIGTHVITARYNGHGSPSGDDTNFNQSTSGAQNLVIGKALTNSSVASNANPAVTGQTIRFTALVSAPGSFGTSPTGTVQFVDGAAIIGSATVTTTGGVSSAILDVPSTGVLALSVGQHVISVQYSGDTTYAASNSPLVAPTALVQVVNKAATTTTISSSANASNVGQSVTLTGVVTVTAPGTGVPTGSVQFINLSAPNQPTVLGTSPIVTTPGPGGSNVFTATLVLTNLPQGNPSIVATYSGDTGYLTSTSAPMIQSVAKTPVNIVLTSSKSPSILGDQVTFAITVSALPPGTGTPTGLVTVFDGTDQIGQFTLQGGQYNFVTTSLAVGNHAIGVQYLGDPNFQPFTSPTLLQIVSKIPTSLGLTSNAPASIASQIVTFTAVLSPNPIPGVNFANGQVGFYDGSNLLGVTNLQSNVATINVANLSVGLHQVSAVYIGDDRWSGASSGFYAQTVSLASTGTAIVSSANPAVYGQPVTYTMTVQVPFPGTVPALGQVQLYDNNNAIGDPISSANGQFSVTIPLFSPGQHSIVARFLGNGSFSASQSATLPQVVNKAPTVSTLAVQPGGSTSKQQVTMTAVVTVPAPSLFGLPTAPPLNASLPTGSVQFVDTTFNKVLGTAPIALVGGVYTASFTTDQLVQSGSPQVLTATYSGDGNFASSTSGPVGQSVFGTQISAVNGAGYTSSNFAPDSWVTIFGDNLSSGQVTAVTTPYPTSLAGTTVSLVDANGTTKLLPLYFVSAGQINALIPTNTAFGLATLTVTNPQGATASTIILITRTAPGIFSSNASGIGVAAALIQRVRSDNSQALENVASYDAANNRMVPLAISAGNDSLYLQLYGTGLRYTPTLSKVTVTIDGKNAPVLYASSAPGFYGLDQINVQVPSGLSGTVNVVVTVDGEAANAVSLTFK